jgi:hypothetical protein
LTSGWLQYTGSGGIINNEPKFFTQWYQSSLVKKKSFHFFFGFETGDLPCQFVSL